MRTEASPLLSDRIASQTSQESTLSTKSEDEVFAENFGMEEPEKTIGPFQSFVLITNNIAGPGLMGLPLLYQQAGIIPVTGSIILICICSSFTGTLLSETIARVPKNSNFNLNLEYSGIFDIIMGKKWYIVAEIFFLLACMVQVITGLVETAQSLDGFIDSYLLGETYALSLYPSVKFLSWSSTGCVVTAVEDCTTPFGSDEDSVLIVTLGYALTTMIFMPFGRGHIKETMTVQVASFVFLVFLLFEFEADFIFNRGLTHSINWFGEGKYSQLVGVILFNYAFAITVPAWLAEKTTDTRINQTIWTSSIFASFLYICFGMLAAFAFEECSDSMLTLLASTEVSLPTRFCAAVFGLTIIGAGVPVFCVIIKNTLYTTKTCNAYWSFFIGSVLPYSTAWCLYKGTLLMDVLNWAGLVVNGLAAFCFPLVLCWWYFSGRSLSEGDGRPPSLHTDRDGDVEMDSASAMTVKKNSQYHSTDLEEEDDDDDFDEDDEEGRVYEIEHSLPECLLPYRTALIVLVVVLFASAICSSILIDIVMGVGPS